MKPLINRIALVTGCGAAWQLARLGATVAVLSRALEEGRQVAGETRRRGPAMWGDLANRLTSGWTDLLSY